MRFIVLQKKKDNVKAEWPWYTELSDSAQKMNCASARRVDYLNHKQNEKRLIAGFSYVLWQVKMTK